MTLFEYYILYFGLLAAGLGAIYYVFIHRFARRIDREARDEAARKARPAE